MFNRFFSLWNRFSYPANDSDIVDLSDELWVSIFTQIEPLFLFNVMQVSQRFKAIAQSDDVFKEKLSRYFPSIRRKPEAGETYYNFFGDAYCDQLSTFQSRDARRLFNFIYERNYQQIKNITITPIMLFEKDLDNTTLISHLNRQNSQFMRDLVFAKIWENYTYPLGFSFSFFCTEEIYTAAVALNQIKLVTTHQLIIPHDFIGNSSFRDQCFLVLCIEYGYLELATYFIDRGHWTHSSGGLEYPNQGFTENHPIKLCAQFNRPEICRLLLDAKKDTISKEDCYYALCRAVMHGHIEMIDLLASSVSIDFLKDKSSDSTFNPLTIALKQHNLKAFTTLLAHYPTFFDNSFLKLHLQLATKLTFDEIMDLLNTYEHSEPRLCEKPSLRA